MCIAIYKPNGVEIPDKKTLSRCFYRNKDGAGFAIYRDGKINLHKGFMTFDSFYNSFMSFNPNKNEPIFIHFRIATHGLVDEGNTHPFPITKSFSDMRKTNLIYKGKVLIHNGIFHYTKDIMQKYDSKDLVSDTMVFSKILSEKLNEVNKNKIIDNLTNLGLEESIAIELTNNIHNKILDDNISKQILYSKVAIMNEDGSVEKYGNWIEENGVFYSNTTFEDYSLNCYVYGNYYQNDIFNYKNNQKSNCLSVTKYKSVCDFCGELRSDCIDCDGENICKDCLKDFELGYCQICKNTFDDKDMETKNICKDCYCQGYNEEDFTSDDDEETDFDDTNICLCCGQNFSKSESSKDPEICEKCYKEYM